MCFISDHFVMFCSVPGGPANVLWRWILQSSGVAQFQDKWLADKELGSLDELQHYYHSEGIYHALFGNERLDKKQLMVYFIKGALLLNQSLNYVCMLDRRCFI